jgi:hypothetical protein
MVPLHIHIVVQGLWQHSYKTPTLYFNKNTQIANDAQEFIYYRFELKSDANSTRKCFAYADV